MDFKHLPLTSADGTQLTLDALYKIAPSCFTEAPDPKDPKKLRHVVDFKKLRQLLGDDTVEDEPEAYDFTWVGKNASRREAASSVNKTLRPAPEISVDWSNTHNIYIEGDNLDAMKLLQKSYIGKINFIYFDPPYNTGNDFVYHDDFKQSVEDYEELAGNVDEMGYRYIKNMGSNGRFHSDWCSMMYPRLMLVHSLLSDDGVLFMSIDDNEVKNLMNIANEIFGDDALVAVFPRLTTKSGKTPLTYMVSHDYILCYTKERKDIFIGKEFIDSSYKYSDEYESDRGKYNLKQPLDCNSISYSPSLDYPIEHDGITYYPGGDYNSYLERKNGNHLSKDYAWRWSKDLYEFGLKNGWIVFQNGRIYTKGYLNATIEKDQSGKYSIAHRKKTRKMSTIDFVSNEFSNDIAKKQLAAYHIDAKFDYPKPVNMVQELLSSYYNKNALVLDIFSGSATTADAVMNQNIEDGGQRRFIMVQLPETVEGGNPEFSTICKIGEERIRRASKKIQEELKAKQPDLFENGNKPKLDTGFRVFRVDSSNMKDVYFAPKDFDPKQLDLFADNVKEGRSDLDLLYGCMVDWGVQLSLPLETETIDGTKVYTVNEGDLVACFSKPITDKVVKAIADKAPLRVLFRDNCFEKDEQKINIFEQFKQLLGWSDDEALNNIRVI